MYDGLSKHDLAIILAHQELMAFRLTSMDQRDAVLATRDVALARAFEFLDWVEQVDREDDIKVGLDD